MKCFVLVIVLFFIFIMRYLFYISAVHAQAQVKADMISPTPGSTFSSSTVTFTWTTGSQAKVYWLQVGTSRDSDGGIGTIYNRTTTSTSATVTSIPTNGRPMYVRLNTCFSDGCQYNEYIYQAALIPSATAEITNYGAYDVLPGATVTFSWTDALGALEYWLWIGTSNLDYSIYSASSGLSTSVTVTNLPVNGSGIVVTLWTRTSSGWTKAEYRFITAGPFPTPPSSGVPAALIYPSPGAVLPGEIARFQWTGGTNVQEYSVSLKKATDGTFITSRYAPAGTTETLVSGVPVDGTPLTVTLSSRFGPSYKKVWQSNIYSYTSFSPVSHELALSTPLGYKVVAVNGAAQSINTTTFKVPPDKTVNCCIARNYTPWFQTDSGDVRFPSLNNFLPEATYTMASNPTYPSLLFSSSSQASLGFGIPSQIGWIVNDEYSYNNNSQYRGSLAYSFYKSRLVQNGITPGTIAGCGSSGCSISAASLTSGVYEVNGNVSITSFNFTGASNKHIILLVTGTTTIQTNMNIPPGVGNLFILASKGDLFIDPSVGDASSSVECNVATDVNCHLDGYYSSEGKIILQSNTTCPTAAKRLNVAGALIANALSPFATGGNGSIQNNRTLCAQNSTYPTYKVYFRPDFLPQLTDFYKVTTSSFREIAP